TWTEFGKRFVPNGARWVVELAHAHAMQGRGAEARQTLQLLDKIPRTFYGADIATKAEYAAEAGWVYLSFGDVQAAKEAVAKASETLNEKADRFDWGFVRLNAQASMIALQEGDATKALSHADAALGHLRTFTEPDGFPFLETRARAARGQAL